MFKVLTLVGALVSVIFLNVASLQAQECNAWSFETESASIGGDFVSVGDLGSGQIIDLAFSSTVDTPGAVLEISDHIHTLLGSSLPATIPVSSLVVVKVEDDPGTPFFEETEFWVFPSYPDLTITSIDGYYFTATMSGAAVLFTPFGIEFENFTLNISSYMGDGSVVCREDTPCQAQCTAEYDLCCSYCNDSNCYQNCMNVYSSCLRRCDDE